MDVSIVVLAWEDIEHTDVCVRSMPAEAELIVVDNGSSAEIRRAVEKLCYETGAVYVQTGENLGYARGMNAGARRATRANIILANNDVLGRPDSVPRLLAALDDPDVGVAFPSVIAADGSPEFAAGRFLTVPVGIAHATGLSALFPRLRITATAEDFDWITGPFVAMRSKTFTEIGGVDESSYFYSEDLRMCWAVVQAGMRVAFIPEAVIGHVGDASSSRRWTASEIARRQTKEYVRAGRQLSGGISGFLAAGAYASGVVLRAIAGRDPRRWAMARGAIEGMRGG